MGMQLETNGDFINEAADDEKYKILHILFDAVYYDFGQKRLVGFKPHTEFVPIFRLAAPLSGWSEKEGFTKDLSSFDNKISDRWFVLVKKNESPLGKVDSRQDKLPIWLYRKFVHQRRGRDSNPRTFVGYTLSKRAR
jgi:hypothetical protein